MTGRNARAGHAEGSTMTEPDEHAAAAELIAAASRRRRGRADAAPSAPAPAPRRRRALRDATAATEPPVAEADTALPAVLPSHAGRGPGAWGAACICAALALAVISAAAAANLPRPLPIERVEVLWLEGPHAPRREVDAWLTSFPQREQLAEANAWVMGKLREHLLAQPGIGEIGRIAVRHEKAAAAGGGERLLRVLDVEVGMRRPYMPAVLASGARVWVDRDGIVLPGSLPGPERRRPLLRQIEAGGVANLKAAVEAWRLVEPRLDGEVVTAIDCAAPLDERGVRGIVMIAASGCRLVWGRPDEQLLGRGPEAKAADLVHTLRCQGDLSRVAVVNVRFAQPFYTLR